MLAIWRKFFETATANGNLESIDMSTENNITITVNGEALSVAPKTSLAGLLRQLEIRSRAIAVELNQQVQASASFESCWLQDGDELEVVTLVGGG